MSEKKTSKKKAVSKRKNETIKESLAGQIVTRGGSVVMGDVLTGGGDFVGRDKKVQTGEGGVVVDGDVTESKIVTGSGNVLHDYDIRISNATIHLAADRFLASLKKEEPSPDLRQATQRYFDYLIARYRYLDMRGLAVHDRLALRLPLLNLSPLVSLRAKRMGPRTIRRIFQVKSNLISFRVNSMRNPCVFWG